MAEIETKIVVSLTREDLNELEEVGEFEVTADNGQTYVIKADTDKD